LSSGEYLPDFKSSALLIIDQWVGKNEARMLYYALTISTTLSTTSEIFSAFNLPMQ
jgi:hypothetical protein